MATFEAYTEALKKPFVKICRLRFLNSDGSTAFALDNNPQNKFSKCFIAGGTLNVNLQNGVRRTADVTIANEDGSFDYSVNNIWFGQEVALDEGLILPDTGEEYYIQQGVFLISNPNEEVNPAEKTVTYHLIDKWANLDGSLGGNLAYTHVVEYGTNIFYPISALLAETKGNGQKIDSRTPVFTNYYNGKTQKLTDGSTAYLTDAPYTLTVDSTNGTAADVVLGLSAMVNALVGYDSSGTLRIDPSQDDIEDQTKPVLWTFETKETQILGMAYTVENEKVYNDYIVIGEQLENYEQPAARVQNYDPASDTNIALIGRKTFRESKSGFATEQQCLDYGTWMLKRTSVLRKTVSVSCTQIMHLQENTLIEIVRNDKPRSPLERHLIQGFSRPLSGTEPMTISCTSVNDYPNVKAQTWEEASRDYLKFTANEAGATVAVEFVGYDSSLRPVNLEYSQNGGPWAPLLQDETVVFLSSPGEYVYVRGENPEGFDNHNDGWLSPSEYVHFDITGSVAASGNVMSLLDKTCAMTNIPNDLCFFSLFAGCSALTSAPNLSATTLKDDCYNGMFYGCENLENAPALPSRSTASGCYYEMFSRCTSLKEAPTLMATELSRDCYAYMFSGCEALLSCPELKAQKMEEGCYSYMFRGCISLKAPANLPATRLAYSCYMGMFSGCTSLENMGILPATELAEYCYCEMYDGCKFDRATDLPATNLAQYCYSFMFADCSNLIFPPNLPAKNLSRCCYEGMFDGCTKLEIAPNLPAATLAEDCYEGMFDGCTKLKYISVGFSEWPEPSATENWVRNVAATGTFKSPSALPTVRGNSNIPQNWTLDKKDYLCFTANEANASVALVKNGSPTATLEYSTDGATWTPFAIGTDTITLPSVGSKVYFRGDNPSGFSTALKTYYQFTLTGSIAASGNVMSLVDSTLQSVTIPCTYCFYNLFGDCASLTTAPKLPATTLTAHCYHSMFRDCTSLTTAPELPATTLADVCYCYMFSGCSSLTATPNLPAMDLASECYSYMFQNCTLLTTAPELPATTLAIYCYASMFSGCTSLTTAPDLPAKVLMNYCYNHMFQGCTSLNFVSVSFYSWLDSSSYATSFWLSDVAENGTFVCPTALPEIRSVSNIPEGWIIERVAPAKLLTSIAVTTRPAKTTYTEGESFSSTGMIITATYSDSSTSVVTGWTYQPTRALETTDTAITVSYTESGVTKTATQAITVNPVVVNVTVTMTNTGSTTSSEARYLRYNSQNKTSGSFICHPGNTITCYVRGYDSTRAGRVTINGTRVFSQTSRATGSYDWTVPSGITAASVTFTRSSYSSYYYCTIAITTS